MLHVHDCMIFDLENIWQIFYYKTSVLYQNVN